MATQCLDTQRWIGTCAAPSLRSCVAESAAVSVAESAAGQLLRLRSGARVRVLSWEGPLTLGFKSCQVRVMAYSRDKT